MTREEAIRALERADGYVGIHYINGVEEAYINPHLREAVKVALSALRPVSRERVEKVPRCEHCKDGKSFDGQVVIMGNKGMFPLNFCPHCGAPMTDEAVEMVMEKINNMEEITNEQ